MNKLLIENINRIKQLMSLITEDVDATCVEGDCENGKGTIKIDYVDGYMEFYEPFDRLIKGFMKNKIPDINYYNSFLITFKTQEGDVVADSELNQEMGMSGYGNITFPDGTTYTGTFTQKKLGDPISMDCKKIVKDNKYQHWDPYTNGLEKEYEVIKDLYYTHYLIPELKKYEKEEEEKIQQNIKSKEEEILNIKKTEEEEKKQEAETRKKQQEQIDSLISKDVLDVQKYIDNKNCSLLYDKITSMVNSGKINSSEKFKEFEKLCQNKLIIDPQTGEPKLETFSKYKTGLYDAIISSCSDYDWDILDDLI